MCTFRKAGRLKLSLNKWKSHRSPDLFHIARLAIVVFDATSIDANMAPQRAAAVNVWCHRPQPNSSSAQCTD